MVFHASSKEIEVVDGQPFLCAAQVTLGSGAKHFAMYSSFPLRRKQIGACAAQTSGFAQDCEQRGLPSCASRLSCNCRGSRLPHPPCRRLFTGEASCGLETKTSSKTLPKTTLSSTINTSIHKEYARRSSDKTLWTTAPTVGDEPRTSANGGTSKTKENWLICLVNFLHTFNIETRTKTCSCYRNTLQFYL